MPQAIISLLSVMGAILQTRGQEEIGSYALLAASLVREGDDASMELENLVAEIESMVADGRDPTPDELDAVARRRQQLSTAIQASGDDG